MEEYKLLRIICDSSLEEELIGVLLEEGIEEYTVFPNIKGSWGKSKKHLNNHVWPGTDSMIFAVIEKENSRKIIEKYRLKKEEMDYYITFKIIVTDVDMYLG